MCSFKVWESQSGKELLSLTGHSDVVYCCAFSSNDARIVSCSADHTVKVCILCYCEKYLSLSYLQLFQADMRDVALICCWKDLMT